MNGLDELSQATILEVSRAEPKKGHELTEKYRRLGWGNATLGMDRCSYVYVCTSGEDLNEPGVRTTGKGRLFSQEDYLGVFLEDVVAPPEAKGLKLFPWDAIVHV